MMWSALILLVCCIGASSAPEASASNVAAPTATTTTTPNVAETFCGSHNKFPRTDCYISDCTDAIQEHIKEELGAAMDYLVMASQYDRSDVARPGLAKFFYESASEERGHAILMLDYLNMRGVEYNQSFEIQPNNDAVTDGMPTMLHGLTIAARMEVKITNAIRTLIKDKCSKDFHAADFLISQILGEQHEGLRKIQGAIKELQNMGDPITNFAEYLLDKKILEHGL